LRKKLWIILTTILLILLLSIVLPDMIPVTEQLAPPASFTEVTAEQAITEEEYAELFLQTGLGQAAVKELKGQPDTFSAELERFRDQMAESKAHESLFLFFPTTKAEVLVKENGDLESLRLPPLKPGDILLTKSTRTLFFRHGHAALVVNEEGDTIESFMLGVPSAMLSAENMMHYSTLMLLRPKEEYKAVIPAALEFAREHLVGLPYNLFTGIVRKDKKTKGVDSTHCSHLVWQAYYSAGLDLDADGGWLVTPHDLSKSPYLDLVFSYGFGEEADW